MTHFEKKFLELLSKRLKLSLFLTKTRNEVDLTAKENNFNLARNRNRKKIVISYVKNENCFRDAFK